LERPAAVKFKKLKPFNKKKRMTRRLANSKQLISYLKNIGKQERSPHVYIIQEREFIRLKESTYKIGETQKPHKRFNNYSKSSELIYIVHCKDSLMIERAVKKRFKDLFKEQTQYGSEYFNGNVISMMDEIDNIINQYYIGQTLTPGLRFWFKKIFKPLPVLPVRSKPRKFKPLPFLPIKDTGQQKSNRNQYQIATKYFKCPKCSKELSNERRLKSHLAKKFPCDLKCSICNEVLPNSRVYSYHQRTIHPQTKEKTNNTIKGTTKKKE
jgi:hypothetical protein